MERADNIPRWIPATIWTLIFAVVAELGLLGALYRQNERLRLSPEHAAAMEAIEDAREDSLQELAAAFAELERSGLGLRLQSLERDLASLRRSTLGLFGSTFGPDLNQRLAALEECVESLTVFIGPPSSDFGSFGSVSC